MSDPAKGQLSKCIIDYYSVDSIDCIVSIDWIPCDSLCFGW